MKSNRCQASLSLFLLFFSIALILTANLVAGAGCNYFTGKGTTKQSVVKNAMNAVLPRWTGSTDVDGFKMDVVAYLNSNGQVAARGWNGNCNPSPNNLAIQTGMVNGVMMGEMYEIARDNAGCRDEPNPNLGQSTPCRPLDGYVGPWSYMSTGIKPAGTGGGGTGTGRGLTFFGQTKYLVFVSYFDALRASDSTLDSDFAYLTSKGIGGIRIFPNWWKGFDYNNVPGDTLMDSSGNLRAAQLSELKNVLNKAQARGLVVDVSFAKETAGLENNFAAYKSGTEAATRELTSYRNVLFDLQNEYDLAGRGTYLTVSQVKSLRDAVKTIDPSRIVTASTTDTTGETGTINAANQESLDVIAYHESRVSNWYSRTSSVVNTLVASGKPVYLQEPERWVGNNGLTGQNFITAATQAKSAGAAAWTFHTESGFDLRSNSLQSQLSSAERNFLDSLSGALSSTTWGVGGSPIIPPAPNPTPGGGSDGSCGQGPYFNKLGGFDYNKFMNCAVQTPKYKAGRVFSNFASPKLTSDVISGLNTAGLSATQVSGSKDVIDFDVEYEPGKKVRRIDVIMAVDDNSGVGAEWQWLPVSGDNHPANPTPGPSDCNAPTGTLPQIDSLSPTTLGSGIVLTISGKFLTHTIQFYGDNGRNSYIGAVNSDCSIATIRVPSDLPSGTYNVKIYKARDKISNGKTITISGSGISAVNPTASYPSCVEQMADPRSYISARAKEDVGIFTVCREAVWSIRNTRTALSCSSDFTYQGVPAATYKSWVENEYKALDDACAGVCHPGVDCERQPASVDKDKIILALDNYLKTCVRSKGISCICNPNPSDPICGPFVPLMGRPTKGPTTINPVTPSKVWSPKLTNNGWFPQISPDGRYVTYGFGESWVVDLQTGQERSFSQATGQSFGGQWIKPDTLTFLNFVSQRENTADRYEVKVGEWIARKTNDDPALVAGNTFVAADNHWASWIADTRNNNFRIAYDNSILATNMYGVAIGNDNWLAFAADNEHSALKVWHNGAVTATYTPQVPLQQWAINKGYVIYGGYGPVHGINPQGQDIDLTVAPWRWEGVGGIIFVEDSPWVFTSSWDDTNKKGYVFIRPWGEKAAITVEAEAAGLDVKYADGKFIIAANGDKGQLKVVKVPANSQRIDLSNPQVTNPNPTFSSSVIATKELGFGTFPDVEFYDGKLWLAVQQQGELKLYNFAPDLSNQQVASFPSYGGQAFPKLTVHNNVLWMAYRIGDNSFNVMPESVKLWRSDLQTTEDLGGGLGNNPIEVGNGYIAWQKDGKVQRRLLEGGEVVAVRDQLPTGISRILPDGTVKMTDDDRNAVPNYADPSWAGDMTTAEDNDNGMVYFFNNNIGSLSRLWQGITTLNPKAAADGNENYAVAAWSDRRGGETVRVAVVKKTTTSSPPTQTNPTTSPGLASVIAAKNLGDGIFPDVAFYQGKLYIAADNKLYLSSYDLSDITLVKDFGYAGFPRLTVYNNALWMAYRGSDDGTSNCGSCSVTVWRSDTGNIEKLPFTAEGNDPVAAGYGYLAFNSQGSFRRRALTGGIVTVIKPNRPTGINRILQDGSIVSVDQTWYSEQEMQATGEHSYAVDWGTKPYVADDLTVVEDSFIGGNTGRFNNDASSQFTVFSGEESFTPHAAADGNGNYVIATWGKPGVRMAVIRKTSGNPTVTPTNPTSNPTNTPLNLPPPNHPILFGYYYADGRYGDYTAEVNSYTNLYIADSSIYDTATDWKPSFRQSLQRASSNNKNILLMVNNENTRNEVLDIAKPFWDNVKLIEVGHEPNWDRLTAESKINELKSQLSAKGLPLKPIGITFVSLSDAVNAQGMDWAGVEAYINPPGDSNTQTNVNQLNSLITQAKSTIPSNKNIVLIMMAYDRNGQWTNMQTLKGLQQPVYMQAYNDPRVIAIAMFSYARTGGARDHAELKEVQQAIGQKILNR